MSRVAVLGAGAWGTALSLLWAASGKSVNLWTFMPEHAHEMAAERCNRRHFEGFDFPPGVEPTSDLSVALEGAEMAVLVVPSVVFRQTVQKLVGLLPEGAIVVSATKGIETPSLLLMTDIIEEVLGREAGRTSAVISGPSFAKEVVLGMPTNVVVAGRDAKSVAAVQSALSTERFRIYSSDDPIGVQVGGALKNVIAIAAGACEGLGFGHNTRAALITRGLAEMSRLAVAMGGSILSLAGLSGLGDLVLTCTGQQSRNHRVGYELAKGRPLDAVLESLGHVAEGVVTAKSAVDLGLRLSVDLPISSEVYAVLYEQKSPEEAVRSVLSRSLKPEWP